MSGVQVHYIGSYYEGYDCGSYLILSRKNFCIHEDGCVTNFYREDVHKVNGFESKYMDKENNKKYFHDSERIFSTMLEARIYAVDNGLNLYQ